MNGYATTHAALLRGTTTDELGDEVDLPTPVVGWERFPASLIERSRSVQDPSSGTWGVISYVVASVPQRLPVQDRDRIHDLDANIVYAIDDFSVISRGIAGYSTRKMELRRVDA